MASEQSQQQAQVHLIQKAGAWCGSSSVQEDSACFLHQQGTAGFGAARSEAAAAFAVVQMHLQQMCTLIPKLRQVACMYMGCSCLASLALASALLLLLPQAGKKTYTLLMGKPNPAKLANFPEIEVFVMLADPQGLILDSKEYLSPIITPHEAYLAFTGKAFDAAAYRLDFGDVLAGGDSQQKQGAASDAAAGGTASAAAAACVGGNVGGEDNDSEEGGDEGWGAAAGVLAVAGSGQQGKVLEGTGSRSGQQVQVHSAAQYLQQHRTYKGLETPATGGEILAAELAVPGRSGRAAVYVDELTVSLS
jgi:diphthamide biosynthesis protein 2